MMFKIIKDAIRRFIEYEIRLNAMEANITSLSKELYDIKEERDEFKNLLFSQLGIGKDNHFQPPNVPMNKIPSGVQWMNEKRRKEAASRLAAKRQEAIMLKDWQDKAEKASQELTREENANRVNSTG